MQFLMQIHKDNRKARHRNVLYLLISFSANCKLQIAIQLCTFASFYLYIAYSTHRSVFLYKFCNCLIYLNFSDLRSIFYIFLNFTIENKMKGNNYQMMYLLKI